MRKLLPLFGMFFLSGGSALADLNHTLSQSVQLTVDSPAVISTRVGSSYSVNGSNISTTDGTTSGNIGGLDFSSITAGVPDVQTSTYSVTDTAEAFTFSQSYMQGDSIVTEQIDLSTGQFAGPNIYGTTTTYTGGTAGSLAGTIKSSGITLTAGGAGTSATGQFISEVTVK